MAERWVRLCYADNFPRLPDEILARLDAEAKARGVTRSSLLRESLEKALSKVSSAGAISCYDLLTTLPGQSRAGPRISPAIQSTWKVLANDDSLHLTYGKIILWSVLQYHRKVRSRSPKASGMP